MAQITYRANLSARSFPFLSQNWGRTVIVPQYDQNFNRQVQSPEDADKDVGIPQFYYCHNVMPMAQGLQSIGYIPVISEAPFTLSKFIQIFLIKDEQGNKAYVGVTDTNQLWIYTASSGVWTIKTAYSQLAGGLVTYAYVAGVTYIWLENVGCFQYDFGAEVFTGVVLQGLNVSLIRGITYAAGYLIAWSRPIIKTELIGGWTAGDTTFATTNTANVYLGQAVVTGGFPADTVIIAVVPGVSFTTSAPITVTGGPNKITLAGSAATIAWSSTILATDFVPSLVTGAGGGSVEAARGTITVCVPHQLGVLVYTDANIVAALYSGNARFPFNFREVVNSGGCGDLKLITYDSNSTAQYAYTTSGLQLVAPSGTQTTLPDLTDFISGFLFEDFDVNTQQFISTPLTTKMQKSLALVSDRYLVISYGIYELTHAIVYDIALKRFGKLKLTHTQCFQFDVPIPQVVEIPKQSLAFLASSGVVRIVDFSTTNPDGEGVLLLGKYQFIRPRWLQLDEINVENIQPTVVCTLKILSTYDGKSISNISDPYLVPQVGLNRQYFSRAIGLNHSLLFQGVFELTSLVLTFNPYSKR